MTAQALIAAQGDAGRFAGSLGWRLRFWLMGLPAGVGLATARAIVKLWIGFPPTASGVASAGNGPAMRAPIIGVHAREDPVLLQQWVRASTRITHTDARAEEGSLALALAARAGARQGPDVDSAQLFTEWEAKLSGKELCASLMQMRESLQRMETADQFAERMGLGSGISGYVNHTVPVALFCWLRYRNNFRQAVESAICLGGDTDSVGAIVGALSGAALGPEAIPADWINGLVDWPCSTAWINRLAEQLAAAESDSKVSPLPLFWPGFFLRNPIFLAVVLAHGFRRLAPPY